MGSSIEIKPAAKTRGLCMLPGDKSICHRALVFAALSNGRCRIENISTGHDVKSTISVLRELGVKIEISADGESAVVEGCGGKFSAPSGELDCGNSATTMRLITGVLASQPFEAVLIGDESLSRRPMQYIAEPLRKMGAEIQISPGGTPPIRIKGGRLRGIGWKSEVVSAQVKSCVVLAGLFAGGDTVFHETLQTRDHTERILSSLVGKETVSIDRVKKTITVRGESLPLPSFYLAVPGDPSSAAYAIALATLLPESSLTVPFVGLNTGRIAFFRHLQEMGAHLVMTQDPNAGMSSGGEPVGEIHIQSSKLKNIPVDPERVPSLIDEIPLLAVVGSLSERDWEITGAERLREKETDRIKVTAEMIRSLGGEIEELEDGLRGPGGQVLTGGEVDCHGDHRIAMAAAVGGWCSKGPTTILDGDCVRISFPKFFERMQDLVEYGW